jgi:hypothetical protein
LKYSLPSLQEGCEGEGCGTIAYDKAVNTVKVRSSPSLDSAVLDVLKKCERIRDFKPVMVSRELGQGRITTVVDEALTAKGIQVGDTIRLRSYSGEGYFTACVGQEEFEVSDHEGLEGPAKAVVAVLTRPRVQGWSRVTTPRAHRGYVPDSERFYLDHYSHDKSLLCAEDRKVASHSPVSPLDRGLTPGRPRRGF